MILRNKRTEKGKERSHRVAATTKQETPHASEKGKRVNTMDENRLNPSMYRVVIMADTVTWIAIKAEIRHEVKTYRKRPGERQKRANMGGTKPHSHDIVRRPKK